MSLITQYPSNLLFILLFLFTFTSPKIKVRSPKELSVKFQNNTIENALSNFGTLPYGHTIVGKLYYDSDDKEQSLGCKPITMSLPKSPKVDESPFIMVDRGECTFTTKIKNIEDASAHVAIIANNEESKTISNIIMIDDGKGLIIKIPSVLISYDDAKKLKDYLLSHPKEQIILEVEFEIEKSDNTVEYDLWYTPDQEQVYTLLGELYYYHQQMFESSMLNIHFSTYSDYNDSERNQKPLDNCFSSGKYCISSKIQNVFSRDILAEMIRQKCVHNITYSSNNSNGFWLYMIHFYHGCFLTKNFSVECSISVMDIAKVESNEVIDCYYKSFTGSTKQKNFELVNDNKILGQEVEDKKNYYFIRLPSLYINKRLFLGELRAETIFEGLCAGLKKKPKVCYSEGGFEKEGKISALSIIAIIIAVIIVNVIIFFICARIIRQRIADRLNSTDINKKIDTVVGSYLKLRDESTSN